MRVLILGAGFAGMGVARQLREMPAMADGIEVTLVDQNNFSLFTPMLTEVAGGEVDADEIVVPIRSTLPGLTFEQGRILSIDPARPSVRLAVGGDAPGVPETEKTLEADHLVIALGAVDQYHGIPGAEDHSLGIKTLEDAALMHRRLLALLERADEEDDEQRRRALLSVVVGGGGFSGVEVMAAVNDMLRGLIQEYPLIRAPDIRTVLVHPGDRVLPELSSRLGAYAQRELERRGVEVLLETEVVGAGEDHVEIKGAKGGETSRIPAHTFIWAGGVKPNPLVESANLPLGIHHGIRVDSCCRVEGHPGVWALGDCAEVPRPDGKGAYAPTAQNAIREGPQVARNIAAIVQGQQPEPFVYSPVGELAIVGRRRGVASLYGFQFSGMLAWALWRAVYLGKLPGMSKRLQVALDWILDLIVGRDVSVAPGRGSARGTGSTAG